MDETIKSLKETINSKLNRYTTFSDNFNLFIREQIGIAHLYDIGDPSAKGYVGPSFEDRLAKINLMIERAEFEDDKLSPNEQALSRFSSEAVELRTILQKIGPQKDICNNLYLSYFFKTLNFQRMEIEQIDQRVQSFSNLTVLNLAHNKISCITYLPPNIKELSLTNNRVENIAAGLKSHSLIHLGLSHNKLTSPVLTKICSSFPNLFSIDVSNNCLSVFETLLTDLKLLQSVKMVNTKGNSVCLNKDYRAIIKQTFQGLKVLDGIPAFTEAEETAKKKKKVKFDAFGRAIIDESTLIQPTKGVTLELQFRLLSNCQGFYLSQESVCNFDQLDMSQIPPERKCSSYSVRFRNAKDTLVSSSPKLWINDFQIDKEAGNLGRTDLNFTTKMLFEDADLESFKEWLVQDLFVELLLSKPQTRDKTQDDGQTVQEVVIGSDGLPVIEEQLIGVMRLELSNLLTNPDLSKEDIDRHHKIPFFDPKLLDRPEFRIKNNLIHLKESDVALLNEALKTVEDEKAQAAAQQQKQQNAAPAQAPGKDNKKVDPKKDAKGKPPAKGAVVADDPNSPKDIVVEYPEVPSLPDYVIIDRSYLKMKEQAKPVVVKSSKAPAEQVVDKKTLRLQELQETYEIIRSKQITCATIVRLNYTEPKVPEEVLKISDSVPIIKPPVATPGKGQTRKK